MKMSTFLSVGHSKVEGICLAMKTLQRWVGSHTWRSCIYQNKVLVVITPIKLEMPQNLAFVLSYAALVFEMGCPCVKAVLFRHLLLCKDLTFLILVFGRLWHMAWIQLNVQVHSFCQGKGPILFRYVAVWSSSTEEVHLPFTNQAVKSWKVTMWTVSQVLQWGALAWSWHFIIPVQGYYVTLHYSELITWFI